MDGFSQFGFLQIFGYIEIYCVFFGSYEFSFSVAGSFMHGVVLFVESQTFGGFALFVSVFHMLIHFVFLL